ncbi:MAG: metal ABC transporter permease [Betaproteobacteria bacterium]
MNVDLQDLSIIAPAFLAGALVLLTHVPLGAQVLKRGIVFIDLAIAQIAALGVIVAGLMDLEPHGWQVQVAAGLAAALGALLLTWTEKRWPEVQEAQIGVVFVLAATGGLLLLANNPHGGEHLRDLLSGQILWVSFDQLLLPTIGTLFIVTLLGRYGKQIGRLGFYLLFSLAVTTSVQLVGVYLVFASLIIPALGVRNHPQQKRLPYAFVSGLIGYALGLLLSMFFDLPSGAMIVWCLLLLAVLAYSAGPRKTVSESRQSEENQSAI